MLDAPELVCLLMVGSYVTTINQTKNNITYRSLQINPVAKTWTKMRLLDKTSVIAKEKTFTSLLCFSFDFQDRRKS